MIILLVRLIRLAGQLLTLLIIAHVILSYFLSPYHPIREAVDRLVRPMLDPIRRLIPTVGMIDFSPFVLLILVQLVVTVLINTLLGL